MYITQGDLEMALGGAAALAQLLDKDGDGIADAGLVTACIERADAEANSALQVRHQLPLVTVPLALKTHAASLAAYYAYHIGTQGQGVPPGVRQLYDDAMQWLTQIAEGTRTLGVAAREASDQLVEQVDTNPAGLGRVNRKSLKGFW